MASPHASRPGAYVLILRLERPRAIQVGRLGTFAFPAGSYAYVGSALGGLAARIARHLRTEKRLHWHIDYLLAHATVQAVYQREASEREECAISEHVCSGIARSQPVPRFGASDCRCHSHLHYLGRGDAVDRMRRLLVGFERVA